MDRSWGFELWQVSTGRHWTRHHSIYYILGTPHCVMFGALECWPGRYSQKGGLHIREWRTQGQENWSTLVTVCLHLTAHQMKFINWCSGDQHIKSTFSELSWYKLGVGNTTQTTGPILLRSTQLLIFSIPGEILCDSSDNWLYHLWSIKGDEIWHFLLIMMHPVLMCDNGVS